jgi:hypothetical protein
MICTHTVNMVTGNLLGQHECKGADTHIRLSLSHASDLLMLLTRFSPHLFWEPPHFYPFAVSLAPFSSSI